MSRSALTRLIHHAFAVEQMARQHSHPPDEAADILHLSLTRRQVLKGSGLLLGKFQLAPVFTRTADVDFSPERILVVGGGIAGLLATYRLRQAGVAVDLVEASLRIGGRLRSVVDLLRCPGTVELGGEFIDSYHTAVRSLVAELGLETVDLHLADRGLTPEVLYFRGQVYDPGAIAIAFAPLATRINRDLQRLAVDNGKASPERELGYFRDDLTYCNAGPGAVALDQRSLADYLDADDVDPVLADLIKAAYVAEYGMDAEAQTCLNMLLLIGSEVGRWNAYGSSDERWHVIGGNEQIPKRLAQRVAPAIETGTLLESIRQTAGDRYRVSLRSGSSSQERVYDRVLLAVPFSVLGQVELAVDLPPLKRRAIAELGYGTSSKLVTHYQQRIWRDRYQSTMLVYTDQNFQNTWESARYYPGQGGWVTNLRGGRQGLELGVGSPDEQAADLTQQLDPIFPGLAQIERSQTLRMVWAAEPHIQGSYACYGPGQWTTFGGVEAERVGNLWFAGEHCAINSQGYINGACETAELAALDILNDIGLRHAAAQQRRHLQHLVALQEGNGGV
jgi:monoamine oxidase